jgi:hypothetical protein
LKDEVRMNDTQSWLTAIGVAILAVVSLLRFFGIYRR